jgi:hypothetical protein
LEEVIKEKTTVETVVGFEEQRCKDERTKTVMSLLLNRKILAQRTAIISKSIHTEQKAV